MGITPIFNLGPLPLTRAKEGKLEPRPMERVENASRSGDETYSPSGGGTANRSEGGTDEDDESSGSRNQGPSRRKRLGRSAFLHKGQMEREWRAPWTIAIAPTGRTVLFGSIPHAEARG